MTLLKIIVYNLNYGPTGPIVMKSPFRAHLSPYVPCIWFFVTQQKLIGKNAHTLSKLQNSNQNIYEFLFWPIYFLNFGQQPNQYICQSTVNKLIGNSRERHVGIKITKKFSLRGIENIKDQFREREMIVKKAITTAASSLQCCSSTIAQPGYSPFGFFFFFFSFFFCFSLFFQSVQYFFLLVWQLVMVDWVELVVSKCP